MAPVSDLKVSDTPFGLRSAQGALRNARGWMRAAGVSLPRMSGLRRSGRRQRTQSWSISTPKPLPLYW